MIDTVGNRTLPDLLRERAARYPDKQFLICEDASGVVTEHSYAGFLDRVRAAAGGLAALGIGKGDTVVVHLPNCAEFVTCWFGLAWLGAVMVPGNIASTAAELGYVMDRSEAVAVITSPPLLDVVLAARDSNHQVKHVVLARAEGERPDTTSLDSLLRGERAAPSPVVMPDDVAEIIFTSGTTSRPKGVLLTHANALRSGIRATASFGLQETDRAITVLPAFHVNAQSFTILAALNTGATCIMIEQYSASRFWSQVRAHRASAVTLTATLVRTLLMQPPSPADSEHGLRRNFFALNVTNQEKEAFEQRFGLELLNGYGLSEAMTLVSVAPLHGDRRWPSVGLPAFDRLIRIVDETGDEVPPGTVGEITVWGTPGRTLMKGYHRDPAATAAALRDGWLHTGDNGWVDEQGYLYFFDRKKDVIKRGGENISASEVESVLLDHPLVAEAAVIGVPDPIRDEAVRAYVVPLSGNDISVEELLAHCRDRLAAFKVPTEWELRASLPKTSVGKIEKKLLRAETSADQARK
jgi:crotonobetaine/carnitine-CoA ligase